MIYLGGDKHWYTAIEYVINYLEKNQIEYLNFWVKSESEDLKLENMIPPIINKVLENENNIAILSCGTGIGVEIWANKFSWIRACLSSNAKIAEWSKIYDKCNVLCLIWWNCDQKEINSILDAWFSSKYDWNELRLKMFDCFNTWH